MALLNNYKSDYRTGKYFQDIYDICTQNFYTKKKWFYGWLKLLQKKIDLDYFKGKKFLEIGCADGAFIAVLREETGIECDGTDMDRQIIKLARRNNPDHHLFLLDIEEHKTSKKYDFIFAFEVLEHIKEPKRALKNIYNSLNKNGICVLSSAYPFLKHLRDPYHVSVKNLQDWKKLVTSLKFKIKYSQVVSFLPFLFRISRKFSYGIPIKIKNRFFVTTNFLIIEK